MNYIEEDNDDDNDNENIIDNETWSFENSIFKN